jgi:hypothetical protein
MIIFLMNCQGVCHGRWRPCRTKACGRKPRRVQEECNKPSLQPLQHAMAAIQAAVAVTLLINTPPAVATSEAWECHQRATNHASLRQPGQVNRQQANTVPMHELIQNLTRHNPWSSTHSVNSDLPKSMPPMPDPSDPDSPDLFIPPGPRPWNPEDRSEPPPPPQTPSEPPEQYLEPGEPIPVDPLPTNPPVPPPHFLVELLNADTRPQLTTLIQTGRVFESEAAADLEGEPPEFFGGLAAGLLDAVWSADATTGASTTTDARGYTTADNTLSQWPTSSHKPTDDMIEASPLSPNHVFPDLGVIPELKYNEVTLSCGMRVLLVPDSDTLFVTGALIFPGGSLSSPASQVCCQVQGKLMLSAPELCSKCTAPCRMEWIPTVSYNHVFSLGCG